MRSFCLFAVPAIISLIHIGVKGNSISSGLQATPSFSAVVINSTTTNAETATVQATQTLPFSSSSATLVSPSSASSVVVVTSSTVVEIYQTRITCSENHMEIVINAHKYPHLKPEDFHLRQKTCRAQVSGDKIGLKTALNACGTTIEETADTITYKNAVRAFNTSGQISNSTITRDSSLELPFNCTYNRKKYVSSTKFEPRRKVDVVEGSFGNFTFTMDLYRDKEYISKYQLSDYPINVQLNDPVFVRYEVKSSKSDLHVFAEKCLATTTHSEKTVPSYLFLDNGCAKDETMEYNYSPNRVQNFTIGAFRFIADYPVVYLHCLLMVCHKTSNTSKCAIGCPHGNNHRPKRDVSRDKQIKESGLYHLSSGALMLKKDDPSEEKPKTPSTIMIILSCTVGFLCLGCLLLLGLLCRRIKRNHQKPEVKLPVQLEAYDLPFSISDDH